MRSLDGHLSRRAQSVWPPALVTHEGGQDYRLERPDAEPLGLGDSFSAAHRALGALLAAKRARGELDAN